MRFREFIDKKTENKTREKRLGVDLVDNEAKDSLVLQLLKYKVN